MLTFMWALLLAGVVLIVKACGRGPRLPGGMTWFDIMPYLVQSQKQRTRLQQTAAHRRRKTRR